MLLRDRTGLGIELRYQLLENARDLRCVAVENGRVAERYDARVIQDDDLRYERLGHGRRVLHRSGDVAAPQVFLVYPSDVESNVVARLGLRDVLVVHFNALHFSDLVGRLEAYLRVRLQYAGLDAANGHGADPRDAVDILDGDPQWLVRRLCGNGQSVQGGNKRRSLVPWHLRA